MRHLLAYWLGPLEDRIAALTDRSRLLYDQTIIQAGIIDQLRAQLRASRAEHDHLLKRYNALEQDYAEVCRELVTLKIKRPAPWAGAPLIREN